MNYAEFLKKKEIVDIPTGINTGFNINPMLFDFQKDIVTLIFFLKIFILMGM